MIDTIVAQGAQKAARIDQKDIVLSATFRDICSQNGCGQYGRCHMCPPDIGPVDELMDTIRQYNQGILYQTIHVIEDSFDIEGMFAAGYAHAACSRRIHEAITPQLQGKFLHLSAGGCRMCSACTKPEGLPCRAPGEALSSMEGYGIDVYQTSRYTELKYINGPDTVTYFGLLLFGEAAYGNASAD